MGVATSALAHGTVSTVFSSNCFWQSEVSTCKKSQKSRHVQGGFCLRSISGFCLLRLVVPSWMMPLSERFFTVRAVIPWSIGSIRSEQGAEEGTDLGLFFKLHNEHSLGGHHRTTTWEVLQGAERSVEDGHESILDRTWMWFRASGAERGMLFYDPGILLSCLWEPT